MQRVMHEDDSQTWERVAVLVRQEPAYLVLGQQQSAGVGIVATEPSGVEAYNMDRQLPTGKLYGLPCSQFRWRERRALQLVFDPGAVVMMPLEDGGFPGVIEAKRGMKTDAIHPA